ncbi:MAG: hypothetical protein GY941_17250 [Planctomycetes bacterium]|nr:hypothetical protein [Planctomycetota bacterium]
MASTRLITIKEKIRAAQQLGALQAGKKIQAAENIMNDAVELVAELEQRVDSIERMLSLCDLGGLVNGGGDGY